MNTYGRLKDKYDARDLRYGVKRRATEIPAMIDMRARVPYISQQERLGSCTANAIGSALDMERVYRKLKPLKPSRLFVYYGERELEGTINEDAGAFIRDGFKVINKLGAPPETLWPYKTERFTKKPPKAAYVSAARHQALKYARVDQTALGLRTCLAEGFPFVFGFTVYDSFESPEVVRTGIVPMPRAGEGTLGGHAVLAVGSNESSRTVAGCPPGYYAVQNSWGDDWGDGGFFYMPKEYLHNPKLASDFWVVSLAE